MVVEVRRGCVVADVTFEKKMDIRVISPIDDFFAASAEEISYREIEICGCRKCPRFSVVGYQGDTRENTAGYSHMKIVWISLFSIAKV